MRRVGNGVMVVGLAVGVYVLLPRLGGLSRDAAELRHARPGFVAAAVAAQAVSLACYALLYRRVLASLGARVPFWLTARVTLASFLVSHVTRSGRRRTALNVSTLNRGRRRVHHRRGDRPDQPGVHRRPDRAVRDRAGGHRHSDSSHLPGDRRCRPRAGGRC
jgi:hypothetical protein